MRGVALSILVAAALAAVVAPAGAASRTCHSRWMTSATASGAHASALISLRPTGRARALADLHRSEVWRALHACLGSAFPPLSRSEQVSVYEQFRCHTRYARVPALGGPTWDFEAFRPVIGMRRALGDVAEHRCNWR